MRKLIFLLLMPFCLFACEKDEVETPKDVVETLKDGIVTINGHEAVDLGLPSGTKWATCNVGATKPEDYGDYYAWGETETNSSNDPYIDNWYGVFNDDLQSRGVIDAARNLTAKYDVATVKWGSMWHMPTKAHIKELSEKCIMKWTDLKSVEGYKVIGPNGKSIFLPASGSRLWTSLDYVGSCGYYWSSATYEDSNDAYILEFNSSDFNLGSQRRFNGMVVRPVTE